jgi:hypothetical protein
VFFDKLGVRWLYEPEGFELPSRAKYLPDFFLPDSKTWIEVKPRDVWREDSRLPEFAAGLPSEEFLALVFPDPKTACDDFPCGFANLKRRAFDDKDWTMISAAASTANAHRFW